MILLTQSSLLPPGSVWLPTDAGHVVLEASLGGGVADQWSEHGRPGHSIPLLQWLQELLRKRPAVNHVCLLWADPDPVLESVVRLLAGQTEDFNVEATLVLAGPIVHQDAVNTLVDIEDCHGANRFLHSVSYLGSEDADGQFVAPARRGQTIVDLVQLLISGGEEAAKKLRLFTANRSAPPFAPFGLDFRGRRPTEVPPAVVGYSRALLARAFESEASKQQASGRIIEKEPATLLDRLGTLHTPRDGGGKWPECLPEVPNAFHGWRPPWFRSAARKEGEHMLTEQRRDAEDGLRKLRTCLEETSTAIRSEAARLYQMAKSESAEFIRGNSSLGGIGLLLRLYFPAVRKLRKERLQRLAQGEKAPCSPASSPSVVDAHARFVRQGQDLLESVATPLLTWRSVVIAAVILIGTVLLSWYLFREGTEPLYALAPALVGLVGIIAWLVRVALARQKAGKEMEEHTQKACEWLRGEFAAKLDWVTGKTQLNLETRVISDLLAIGRRLRTNFDSFFQAWSEQLNDAPDLPTTERDLGELGIEEDGRRRIADSIAEVANTMVTHALDDRPDWEGGDAILRIFQGVTHKGVETAMRSVVPISRHWDWLEQTVRSPRRPAILARVDGGHLQSDVVRTFLLPESYEDEFNEKLSAELFQQATVESQIWVGPVSGPAVWIARRFLPAGQVAATLTTTEVRA